MIRTALRTGVAALLAAGVVGLVRQRGEVSAAARGELAPLGASTRLPPPAHESPAARRMSAWVPARPRTTVGRVAAALNALPLTLVGAVIGLVGGGRPRWDREHGCLVFEGVAGPPARVLRTLGAGANAVGQVVISTRAPTPEVLLAHEAAHVRQAERLGLALLPAYVAMNARYGYRQNPLERAARQAAARRAGGAGR